MNRAKLGTCNAQAAMACAIVVSQPNSLPGKAVLKAGKLADSNKVLVEATRGRLHSVGGEHVSATLRSARNWHPLSDAQSAIVPQRVADFRQVRVRQ